MDTQITAQASLEYERFKTAMSFVFKDRTRARAWREDDGNLILGWHEEKPAYNPLPYEMDCKQATDFAWGWLCANSPRGNEPDTDGSTGKGFYLHHRDWNAYKDDNYALIVVRPIWMVYGK